MDRKAEEYRRKAEAAKAAADFARDDAAKQIYLEKARRLREMANRAEQSCPPNVFPQGPPRETATADDRTLKGEQDRSAAQRGL
jgi:hypothetical protein